LYAVIFANGELNYPDAARELAGNAQLVIAADGGLRHCHALGLMPDLLIGDLDSVTPAEAATLQEDGSQVLTYPARKDFTDLELAIQEAQRRGFHELFVLAALGARWDQTLANVLLPATDSYATLRISLVDGPQEILLLRGPSSLEITGQAGDIVSLIPLGGHAQGLTTEGLEYPLQDETLYFGATRGISNVLTGAGGTVTLRSGIVLCVLIHHAPAAPGGQDRTN
jgi:thiamine pyrophosphokinase